MQKQDKGKLCFVIAPIGDEGTAGRQRSDQVFNHIITPVAKECGYEPIRADKISEPGIITSQVIQHLLDDALVIADLTDRNANVFYELAIRHAVRKPVVLIIRAGERIPFDVAQSRTIQVDHTDLDSVDRCKKEICKQIRAVERDPGDVDTPLSVAIDIQHLRQSENPLAKSNAEIISLLQDIRVRLETLSSRPSVAGRQIFSTPGIVLSSEPQFVLSTEEDPKSGEHRIVFRRSEDIGEPLRVFTRPESKSSGTIQPHRVFVRQESEASEKIQPRRVFTAPEASPSEKIKGTK